MKIVTLDVRDPNDSKVDFARAWNTGEREKSARISFGTPELLWKVLTAKRWELLKVLCGAGPVSIREAAKRVGRDVKGVHNDVTALLAVGVLDRAEGGGIIFPYDAVKVEFLLIIGGAQPVAHEDDEFLSRLKTLISRVYRIPAEDVEDILKQALLAFHSAEKVCDPESWLIGQTKKLCLLYWRENRRKIYSAVDEAVLTFIDRDLERVEVKSGPTTGEKPGKGTYTCNKCGQVVVLDDDADTLPTCPRCSGTDFVLV